MQMRTGVGWQYALTDLSLILFMVSASALSQHARQERRPPPPAAQRAAPGPVAVADPVALWRPGAGAPSLGEWLASQPRDPRQRLTIEARYAGAHAAEAAGQAARLLAQAGERAGPVRIVVEPGAQDDLSAALTWDVASPVLAQGLQQGMEQGLPKPE